MVDIARSSQSELEVPALMQAEITLTTASGAPFPFSALSVIRIRTTFPHDPKPQGATLIDFTRQSIQVKEDPEKVAGLVKAHLSSLAQFIMSRPNDDFEPWQGSKPVWVNAKAVKGPIIVVPTNRTNGIRSSIQAAGKMIYVTETPEEVAEIIGAAGGTPEPVLPDIFNRLLFQMRSFISPIPEWY